MSDYTLPSLQTNTLSNLQDITQQYGVTQNQLNSGKKVNQPTDNTVAYFRAQSLSGGAASLLSQKSNIDQAIQTVQASLTATSSTTTLLTQLKAVVEGAKTAPNATQLQADGQQFLSLSQQVAQLVKDASYQGVNLLTSSNTTLNVQISNSTAAAYVTIAGYNLTTTQGGSTLGLFTNAGNIFGASGAIVLSNFAGLSAGAFSSANFTALELNIDTAISHIKSIAGNLGNSVSILQTRSSFNATLSGGDTKAADSLTLADLNEAAANSSALNLRQQLSVQALSLGNTQSQQILNLLR
jgi:flagellin-like hook-associated protein FlgL